MATAPCVYRRKEPHACYGCQAPNLTFGESLRGHINHFLGRGEHELPPAQWLAPRNLVLCMKEHVAFVHPSQTKCAMCRKKASADFTLACWACAWEGAGLEHANKMLAEGSHAPPGKGWLEENRLHLCSAPGHRPYLHQGPVCDTCQANRALMRRAAPPAGGDASVAQPAAARPRGRPPRAQARAPGELATWLSSPDALARVEKAADAARDRRARRFLPSGMAARRIAANAVLDVANAALAGIPAAQALFPILPRVLLARDVPVAQQIAALMHDDESDPAEARGPQTAASDLDRFVRRLRAATAARDLRAINRLLEEGPTPGDRTDSRSANSVIRAKFPRKELGEVKGARGEAEWAERVRALCGPGGRPVEITTRELIRWARAKRDKAADAGGFSGRLILELHETDPAVADALAAVYSMPLDRWVHRDGAARTWRVLVGAFVPQVGKSPRPVATAPVARRAWGSAVVRRLRDAAATYCEARGQYGMSRAGGQTAYVLAAQVLHALGADIVVDDRANSFHNVYRSSVLGAAEEFTKNLPAEERAEAGGHLVELLERTFLSSNPDSRVPPGDDPLLPRSRYVFGIPGVATKVHTGLCQGSSESSLLEAITYATTAERCPRPPGVLRCELHDDGFAAAFAGVGVCAFARPEACDGSLIAEGKNKAIGPRAAEIVAAGHSREAVAHVLVAGVPVGEVETGLQIWEARFAKRLQRLRDVATIDPVLAAHAASAVGGPAGMANHILRALPPSDVADAA